MVKKAYIPHLETHVTHSCNLKCKNCSHYCDIGYYAPIDHRSKIESIKEWSQKIVIDKFAILGGEPLLESQVTDYIESVAKCFKNAERRLVTNGLLLHYYDDAFAKLIKKTNTRLIISLHIIPEGQKESLLKSLRLVKEWIIRYSINATIKPLNFPWFKIYHGYGHEILPFNDNNPKMSRAHCVTPCVNLHEGALWKCPPLAYLPNIIDKLKYKNLWKPYLKYQPLQISATYEELNNISKDINCCDMCPQNPQIDNQNIS